MEGMKAEAAWISARKRRCEGQVCLRWLRGPRTWPHQDQDRVAIIDGVLLRTTAWTLRCTHCGPHCLQTMSCSVHGLGEFYAVAKRNWLMHCRARDSILRMYSTPAICIECARAEAAWVSARKRRCEGQVCLRRLRGPRTWPHQDRKIELEFLTVFCFALRLGRNAVRTAARTAYKRCLAVCMAWVSLTLWQNAIGSCTAEPATAFCACTACLQYAWSARGLKPHESRLESVGVRGRSACDGCEGSGHGRTRIKIESQFLTVCCFALRLGRYAVRTAYCTA